MELDVLGEARRPQEERRAVEEASASGGRAGDQVALGFAPGDDREQGEVLGDRGRSLLQGQPATVPGVGDARGPTRRRAPPPPGRESSPRRARSTRRGSACGSSCRSRRDRSLRGGCSCRSRWGRESGSSPAAGRQSVGGSARKRTRRRRRNAPAAGGAGGRARSATLRRLAGSRDGEMGSGRRHGGRGCRLQMRIGMMTQR